MYIAQCYITLLLTLLWILGGTNRLGMSLHNRLHNSGVVVCVVVCGGLPGAVVVMQSDRVSWRGGRACCTTMMTVGHCSPFSHLLHKVHCFASLTLVCV